jgi:hypothetical protein
MTGTTATQGFIYPTSTDTPCSLTSTLDTLGAQLDTKLTGYATDLARIKWPPMVRISTPTYATSGSYMVFTTVEYNHSTPTDLSLVNQGIILNAGYWLVYGRLDGAGTSSTSPAHFLMIEDDNVNVGIQKWGFDAGPGFITPGVTVVYLVRIAVDSTTLRSVFIGNGTGSFNLSKLVYGAVKMADL